MAMAKAARGVRLGPEQWPGSVLRGARGPRLPHAGYCVTGMRRIEAGERGAITLTRAALRGFQPLGPAVTEERGRPVLLILDRRARMHGGSGRATRAVLATEAAALFAHAAAARQDRIGALIFDEAGFGALRPHAGAEALTRLLARIRISSQAARAPALADPPAAVLATRLDCIARLAPAGHLLFLLSDFDGCDRGIAARIIRLARRNWVVLCPVIDPLGDIAGDIRGPHLVALAEAAEAANLPMLPLRTTEPTAPQVWRMMGVPA